MPTRVINFGRPMPIFPLPQCVLLPHATVPLHIFEPRYRRMVGDVLDKRGLLALATFEGDEWKRDYMGSPPVRPFVCVGQVAQHDRLPDGRYNLLLQGLCRARILEEVPHEHYRLMMLEPADATDTTELDLARHRQTLERWINDPVLQELATVNAVKNWLSNEIPTAVLVDLATMALSQNVEERYQMLSETQPLHRVQWLTVYLQRLRRTLKLAKQHPSDADEDGLCLN